MDDNFLIFVIPVLILSVIIHEIAHGYAALFLGDPTAKNAGRLTLNPFPHIDLFGSIILPIITSATGVFFGYAKPVPYNPHNLRPSRWSEAIVAISGPFSNFLLAIIFALITRVFSFAQMGTDIVFTAFFYIIFINIFLGLLNLIPVAPLDGSKVMFALLPYRKSLEVRDFMQRRQFLFIIILLFFLIKTNFLYSVAYFLTNLIF